MFEHEVLVMCIVYSCPQIELVVCPAAAPIGCSQQQAFGTITRLVGRLESEFTMTALKTFMTFCLMTKLSLCQSYTPGVWHAL